MTAFALTATDKNSKARVGRLITPHGVVRTPAFMPVGTQGTVKSLTVQDLKACGVQILLSNVYHLSLRPGAEIIRAAGGLHSFMAWDGPILTDSGGYQVFSLSEKAKVKIKEESVQFSSPIDGSVYVLTPEGVVQFQQEILGSDVVIPLDHCVHFPCERPQTQEALERTTRWAKRSKEAFKKGAVGSPRTPGSLLFGIVQGGTFPELRQEAAEQIIEIGFDGYCLGGFSVGEPKELMYELLPQSAEALPQDKPRYLMGMGEPLDLIEAVQAGIDMFDCVIPTRHGRNGVAYTWTGKLNLRNALHTTDNSPVDSQCGCPVCKTHSRMYIRHLFQTQELLGLRLLSFHNLWFYSTLMAEIRRAIEQGSLKELSRRLEHGYQPTLEGTF